MVGGRSSVVGVLSMSVLACGGTLAPPDQIDQAPDIASVRLFDSKGAELTQHLPLVSGQSTRVIVRLYAPDGHEITSVKGGIELGFSFTSASFASSTPVEGQVLTRDITPTAPAGTYGALFVSLTLIAYSLSKSFGPFEALVH